MNRNKKIAAIAGSATLAAVVVAGTALALFTDNADGSAKATAGTVDIEATAITMTNADNINPGDGDPTVPNTYVPTEGDPLYDPENPGKEVPVKTTEHNMSFTITNSGNKSIRTRHTFVLSAKDDEGNFLDARAFKLLEDKVELGGKVFIASDDTEYTSEASIPAGTVVKAIRYRFTPDIFNGTGVGAETEDVATVDGDSKDYSYSLSMAANVNNDYQGAKISVDAVFEAMQFRNTVQDDWNVVSTDSFTASVANPNLPVAPSK